jgi:hypothetical protein
VIHNSVKKKLKTLTSTGLIGYSKNKGENMVRKLRSSAKRDIFKQWYNTAFSNVLPSNFRKGSALRDAVEILNSVRSLNFWYFVYFSNPEYGDLFHLFSVFMDTTKIEGLDKLNSLGIKRPDQARMVLAEQDVEKLKKYLDL